MGQLRVELGDGGDLAWAQQVVTYHHYLKRPVDARARPMVYVLWLDNQRVGLIMVGLPHATRCGGWWGYPGLPTQWQVLDLCRIWLHPAIQIGGELVGDWLPGFTDRKGVFRPTVASWFIGEVLARVQQDRVSLWPPVYLDEPYHIRLVISYHDPQYHRGTIYKVSGAEPVYTEEKEVPLPGGEIVTIKKALPGPSGKFCWAWRMERPCWDWQDIEIRQPRTVRMF